MAESKFWKGSISFGLVEVPVSLRPATDGSDLHFTLLDRDDFAPVGNKRYNKNSGREVDWDHVVRGFEYEPGEYVVLSDEELRQANVKASQTIELLTFVKAADIDPVYFETPYFIEPLKQGSKSYTLLRAALERSQRVGIAHVVLRTRQRLAAVLVRKGVMMLDLLRYSHELREPGSADEPAKGRAGVSERELELATRLIEDMTGKWNPGEYHDEYRDDVLALVKRKVKSGRTHTIVEPRAERAPRANADVMDLMPLLKKSLGQREHGRGSKPSMREREALAESERPRARRTAAERPSRRGPARARARSHEHGRKRSA